MTFLIMLSLICLASPECKKKQPPTNPEPQPTVRRVVAAWLECEECQEGQLEAVVRLGAAAVPPLAASLREGPPPAGRELLRRHLVATYRELKEYESTHPEAKVTLTEEEYVATYTENYVALYRTRSARALGAIGGAEARRALEDAARAPLRDDVLAAVRAALEKAR